MMKGLTLCAASMLAMLFFVSCEEELTTTIVYDEVELSLSEETVYLSAEAGDEASVVITTDQSVIDINVDYSCKTWLEAELNGTTITVRTIADNTTTEEKNGWVSVVAGEKGVTGTAYLYVVQAAGSE